MKGVGHEWRLEWVVMNGGDGINGKKERNRGVCMATKKDG